MQVDLFNIKFKNGLLEAPLLFQVCNLCTLLYVTQSLPQVARVILLSPCTALNTAAALLTSSTDPNQSLTENQTRGAEYSSIAASEDNTVPAQMWG